MIKINPLPQPLEVKSAGPIFDESSQRRLKLKQATQAFESIFIAELLRNMRASSLIEKKEDGFGKDIMMAMADEGVARQLAKSGMFGIGEKLYRNLVKRIDAGNEPASKLKITQPRQIDGIAPPIAPKIANVSGAEQTIAARETEQPTQATVVKSQVAKEATPRSSHPSLQKFIKHIESAAAANDLPVDLLEKIIIQESAGNSRAISPKGAVGLMQLMPDTARAVGVRNRFDPAQNIHGGARYLRQMIDRFGDLEQAIAAYNAGPGNVVKYGGVPPFAETQDYVRTVLGDRSAAPTVK